MTGPEDPGFGGRADLDTTRALAWFALLLGGCVIVLTLANGAFTLWQVRNSQAVWCHVIDTLNNPPPSLKGTSPASTPGRVYDEQLAREFSDLKRELGC